MHSQGVFNANTQNFQFRLAVFQARGGAHIKLCLSGTVNRLNVEHRTLNVQYGRRYALSILKQANRRISNIEPQNVEGWNRFAQSFLK
jgi:hypothetical protein